jgi:hypothetical protein
MYKKHQKEIESYLAQPTKQQDVLLSNGNSTSFFIVALVIVFSVWIWALYALWKYWYVLPVAIRWLALLSMFTGAGPLVSLVLIYVFRTHQEH